MEKKCKKAKWLSGEAFQIAVKRRVVRASAANEAVRPWFAVPAAAASEGIKGEQEGECERL